MDTLWEPLLYRIREKILFWVPVQVLQSPIPNIPNKCGLICLLGYKCYYIAYIQKNISALLGMVPGVDGE